jgi:MFS family permease
MTTIVAFGIVSLFADIVYEGARGIIGPFLLTLGASAAVVGLVSGAGEFVGYAIRSVTGILADRTRAYWTLTIAGYAFTVIAVPLLGLVGRVDLALALVVAERLGKAIRSPAKDTLLADAAEPLGVGWGFGLHEAMDQTGAVAGPLILSAILAAKQGDYRLAFLVLAIPGILTLAALLVARRQMPSVRHAADPTDTRPAELVDKPARLYMGFVFLAALGFAPFPLIAFHLSSSGVVADPQIPLMFALAMAVDAVAAVIAGRLFDRRGLRVLVAMPFLTALALFGFATTPWITWLSMLAWGAVMGIHESTLRAAVATLSVATRRATAYGIFNTAYGVALLAGGALLGYLYGHSMVWVVAFSLTAEVLALTVLRLVADTPLRGHS